MIQQGDVGSIPGELPAFDPGALSAGNVNVLRDLKSTVFAEGLGEMDAMTLDVVSMLFDFILDDKNVPSAMQALIGRLQIPVLKAAMLDKFTIIRSVRHDQNNHGAGNHYMMTGAPTRIPVSCGAYVSFHPSMGSVVSKLRGASEGMPPYFSLPSMTLCIFG